MDLLFKDTDCRIDVSRLALLLPENLLKMKMLGLHYTTETLKVGPRNLCFNKPSN